MVASGDEFSVGQQARVARSQALQDFRNDETIDILIMDGVATVGHDLSCVDYIVSMESIPQKSAWQQLVSRAYLPTSPIIINSL